MATGDTHRQPPVLAAYAPVLGAIEPVEFGLAASRVLGTRCIVAAIWTDANQPWGAARQDIEGRGLDVEVHERQDSSVGAGLTALMGELQPQLVVVGTTHRGHTGSALLGTTAERVIHDSRAPVAVVPRGYRRPDGGVRRIGAAYAPTPEGREALHAAVALGRAAGRSVRAIQVLDDGHAEMQSTGLLARAHHDAAPEEDMTAQARLGVEKEFADAVAELAGDTPVELDVLFNDAAEGLLAAASRLDLLVMGSRAFGRSRAVLLGSVSRKVAERAPCPVLIVPRHATEATEEMVGHAAVRRP